VLKSLDIVIGLTVVLLALSMAVTVITQAITTVINSRGRHLRRGLTDLLQQLDPALTETLSKAIATGILTHPLVSGSTAPFGASAGNSLIGKLQRLSGGARLGNVVHREEFTKLLMAAATGQSTVDLTREATAALTTALANNGVADPEATLRKIRGAALQLERDNPEASHVMRQNLAILREAETDLVAKINNWFDQTMDRTSQRFTASTRAITFAGAFLVAFGLQVDTPALVNRLAADDALRAAFVEEAQALHQDQQAEEQRQAQQEPAAATVTPEEIGRKYQAFLATNGVITLPTAAGWSTGFANVSVFGMLLTALLLSLGAPFWYSALGNLLQLRSVLAIKDDAQRKERQTTDPAKGPGPGGPASLGGGRSDLAPLE
jgi:hypothetical protein